MSALIPSELKVVDLRKELAARNLPSTGLKKDLVQRLEEALAAGTPVQPSAGEDDDQIDLLPDDEAAELEADEPEMAMNEATAPDNNDESAEMMDADDDVELGRKRKAEEQATRSRTSTDMETENATAVQAQLVSEDSLYIKNLERPLTVYRLKEVLGKYGVVEDAWLNSIKTRGYVSYETKQQAEAAHAAINGTRFPTDYGKVVESGFITRSRLKELITEEEASSESVRNVDLLAVPVEGGNCGVALINPKAKSNAGSKKQKTHDSSDELKVKQDKATSLAAETSASLITAAAAAAASDAKNASSRGRRGERAPEADILTRIERDAFTRVTRIRPAITYRPLTEAEVAAKHVSSA
ncbi:hypothetical protein IWW38_001955 [Coemansia aciculifera]|uniref:Uncharacterized protein n=1 Tax=Coemansia aciculifera TaxID=417176 RepID=A0ACC1M5U2_9FUNG|nr:hypothetical protein IWW38_001955 [Coemansia aciculifera]